MNIPIIVYGGEKEENFNESLLNRYECIDEMKVHDFQLFFIFVCRWKELTTAQDLFRIRIFPGHHNFQVECGPQVISCLKEDFNNIINISKIN